MYHRRRCWKWLCPASIHSCARLIMLRYTQSSIVLLMAAAGWLMLSLRSCIVCGFDSYTVLFKCLQRKFLPPSRVYLNMVTARLLTNFTLRNTPTHVRQNITRTRAKRKKGYFFVAHPVKQGLIAVHFFLENKELMC